MLERVSAGRLDYVEHVPAPNVANLKIGDGLDHPSALWAATRAS